jgi:NADPH-dependent 7-cyano-7-deazaguanine reductase QueF
MSDEDPQLEAFDAPNRSHVATFEIESKSLKQYLQAFRSREITAEALAVEIADAVEQTIAPERLYVRLEQARRGGIEETVEVGNADLR